MVSSKEWTKTDPNDAKTILLTTHLYKLDKEKNSVLATVQGVGGNRTQILTKTKGRDPNKSYVEGINNIEPWRVKKSKDKVTRDGQD